MDLRPLDHDDITSSPVPVHRPGRRYATRGNPTRRRLGYPIGDITKVEGKARTKEVCPAWSGQSVGARAVDQRGPPRRSRKGVRGIVAGEPAGSCRRCGWPGSGRISRVNYFWLGKRTQAAVAAAACPSANRSGYLRKHAGSCRATVPRTDRRQCTYVLALGALLCSCAVSQRLFAGHPDCRVCVRPRHGCRAGRYLLSTASWVGHFRRVRSCEGGCTVRALLGLRTGTPQPGYVGTLQAPMEGEGRRGMKVSTRGCKSGKK